MPNPPNHEEVGAGEGEVSGGAGGETPSFLEPYFPDNQLGLEEYQFQTASPDAALPSPARSDALAEPEGNKVNDINGYGSALGLVHSCARPLRQSHPEPIQPIGGIEIIESDDDETSS